MRIAVIFTVSLFLLIWPHSSFGADEFSLSGRVMDSEGAAISNAILIIHWDSSGSKVGLATNVGIPADRVLHADEGGRFNTALPPGFYDVFVSAMAFSPQCTKVRILGSVQYSPKLNSDPLMGKELAH